MRYYTRESGVRSLEREISKICRKVVKEAVLGEGVATTVVSMRKTWRSIAASTSSITARPRRKIRSGR
jgi:ATP-dependent Lon protease